MKNLSLLVACFLAGFVVSQLIVTTKDKPLLVPKYQIDLPEEIHIAELGDSLEVYAISEDVIYIGFKKD